MSQSETKSPLAGKLKVAEVARRYQVSIETITRWVRIYMFPSPLRVGGVRYWSETDLELFDEWCVDRSVAAVKGKDVEEVEHPAYTIPMPTLDEILEATA